MCIYFMEEFDSQDKFSINNKITLLAKYNIYIIYTKYTYICMYLTIIKKGDAVQTSKFTYK